MAIAYVASGAVQKVTGASSQNIPLPAGHISGHTLLLFSLTDDQTGLASTPSGWTKLGEWTPGLTTGFLIFPRVEIYWRTDNGSLGANVAVSYSTVSWPTGNPSILTWVSAYSGCDSVAPVENRDAFLTTGTTASQLHPAMTSIAANDWLLTMRAAYSATNRTFTASGGSNTERIDDNYDLLHAALYDSAAALAAGPQTQRTTVASGSCSGGGVMLSVLLKPAPVAGSSIANPTTAEATGTAYNPSVATTEGNWGLCTTNAPVYEFDVDWAGDGSFTGDITPDTITEVSINYGRDQDRQLNPARVGDSAFDLVNVDRIYSPEYAAGPLYGELDPARPVRFRVTWNGAVYPLFRGQIDDYEIRTDRDDRRVSLTFLDDLNDLAGINLSTGVYSSLRTGDLVNIVLDLAGWDGPRDVDPGATVVRYWWEEGSSALDAVQKLVRSEGPPSVAYVAPDGTFVFRDRHHRILRQRSVDVQGSFGAKLVNCAAPAVTGLRYTKPFTYTHGLRDIVNVVNFDVTERAPDSALSDVWTSDSSISLSIGQSQVIDISASDPFMDAVVPVQGTDYTLSGVGTVNVGLSRTDGQSVRITLLAVGGAVVLSGLKLRARALTARRTVKISQTDSASVSLHGERTFPNDAPWAGPQDALAIANMVLLYYSVRRPTVKIRIVAQNPAYLTQILQRTISDRVRIANAELGLDADFFVESVSHVIQRINVPGKPPVHSVTLGCEKNLEVSVNPFTFDLKDAGFDKGVFDPISSDDRLDVMIFDDPVNGQFSYGKFGT